MDTEKSPGRRTTIVVIAIFLLIAIASMFNQPSGPVTETTGIVQAFTFIPSDVGAPPQVASVRLIDGTLVRANVRPGVLVQPGQIAKVLVYRRVITGASAYELVSVE